MKPKEDSSSPHAVSCQLSNSNGSNLQAHEGKGTIVLISTHDAIASISNTIKVNRTWGSSSDWMLELQDGKRLSIPFSILSQPRVATLSLTDLTPAVPLGPIHAGYGVLGSMTKEFSSLRGSEYSDKDDDEASLVWEDP